MWVYTNSPTWELIGNKTPTWKRIGTVMWVYTNTLTRELNRLMLIMWIVKINKKYV